MAKRSKASKILLGSRGRVYNTTGVSGQKYKSRSIGSIALPDAAGFLTVVSHMAAVGGAAALVTGAVLYVHLTSEGGLTATTWWTDLLKWIKKEIPGPAGDALISLLNTISSKFVGFIGGVVIAGCTARQLKYNLSYIIFIIGICTWLPPFRAGLYYAAAIYGLSEPLPNREKIVAYLLCVAVYLYFVNPITAGSLAPPAETTTPSSNSGR